MCDHIFPGFARGVRTIDSRVHLKLAIQKDIGGYKNGRSFSGTTSHEWHHRVINTRLRTVASIVIGTSAELLS